MATKILLPRLGESVEEAAIGRWLKSVGDPVERGDVIAELETAKAMMELESPIKGYLLAVFPEIGETIQMGELVAVVGKKGEAWQDVVEEQEISAAPKKQTPTSPDKYVSDKNEALPVRLRISPNARRVAREHNIDLSTFSQKADGERIIAEDILQIVKQKKGISQRNIPYKEVKLNQVERVTAKRMVESANTIPQFSISMEVDVKKAIKKVNKLNKKEKTRITLTAYILKKVAMIIKDFPRINARFAGGIINCYQHVNIALAVATGDGLYVPVIRQADQLKIKKIAKKISALARECRDRTISPDALSGATFTISNLGMKGVRQFVPIIDPSQSAILGVGEVFESFTVKKDGTVKPRKKMILTLTCDHRVVDGAGAADFLSALCDAMESA